MSILTALEHVRVIRRVMCMGGACFNVPLGSPLHCSGTRCVVRLTLRAGRMHLRTAALSSKGATRVGRKKLSTAFQPHCMASSRRAATSRTCAARCSIEKPKLRTCGLIISAMGLPHLQGLTGLAQRQIVAKENPPTNHGWSNEVGTPLAGGEESYAQSSGSEFGTPH
jgi:hypothetical protein